MSVVADIELCSHPRALFCAEYEGIDSAMANNNRDTGSVKQTKI
jgi:hypothetical protein